MGPSSPNVTNKQAIFGPWLYKGFCTVDDILNYENAGYFNGTKPIKCQKFDFSCHDHL